MKTDLYAWATARCAKQEFSRADICSKLMGKGASAEEARTLTERLVDERYVDDARFAAAFVADKIRFDHWGRIKIRYMLHLKGVADDLVEEALEQIDETAYTETLKQFLNSRLGPSRHPLCPQAESGPHGHRTGLRAFLGVPPFEHGGIAFRA